MIGQAAPGHGRSRHQVYKGRRPRQSASVILWNLTCHHAFRNVAKKSGKQKRKESRRLVLPREDAKAVDKYSRRGYKERLLDENGDKRLLKDAIYMATRQGRRGYKEV